MTKPTKPTKPYSRKENGFFGFATDYWVASGKDDTGRTVKGTGRTKQEAEDDYRDKARWR